MQGGQSIYRCGGWRQANIVRLGVYGNKGHRTVSPHPRSKGDRQDPPTSVRCPTKHKGATPGGGCTPLNKGREGKGCLLFRSWNLLGLYFLQPDIHRENLRTGKSDSELKCGDTSKEVRILTFTPRVFVLGGGEGKKAQKCPVKAKKVTEKPSGRPSVHPVCMDSRGGRQQRGRLERIKKRRGVGSVTHHLKNFKQNAGARQNGSRD